MIDDRGETELDRAHRHRSARRAGGRRRDRQLHRHHRAQAVEEDLGLPGDPRSRHQPPEPLPADRAARVDLGGPSPPWARQVAVRVLRRRPLQGGERHPRARGRRQVLQELAGRFRGRVRALAPDRPLRRRRVRRALPRGQRSRRRSQISERFIDAGRGAPFEVDGASRSSPSAPASRVSHRVSTAGSLLRDADTAINMAKERGRARRRRVRRRSCASEATRRLAIETALERALDRDELQPRLPAGDVAAERAPVGCEALLRWDHPQLGAIARTTSSPSPSARAPSSSSALGDRDGHAAARRAWQPGGAGDGRVLDGHQRLGPPAARPGVRARRRPSRADAGLDPDGSCTSRSPRAR